MGDVNHPKLKCAQTGTVIDLNCNPFSIGRGLSCNFVITRKPVSRVHCVLEKDDGVWVLRDTSTNGTLLNNVLYKGMKSPPLKSGDVIKLDMEGDSYVFETGERNQSEDISDEQLCSIADSVLGEVEALEQEIRNNEQLTAGNIRHTGNVMSMAEIESATTAALQDHLGMAKKIDPHLNKRQKTEELPSRVPITTDTSLNLMKNAGESSATVNAGPSNTATAPIVDLTLISEVSAARTLPVEPTTPLDLTLNSEVFAARTLPVEPTSPLDLTLNSEVFAARTLPVEPGPTAGTVKESPPVTSVGTVETIMTPGQPPQAGRDQQDNYEVMENELQCVICSELFVKAVTLQCSHTFCKYCIEMWKKTKSECPICRQKITSMTSSLVLENIIEKVVEGSSEETKQRRKQMLEERKTPENSKSSKKQTITTRTNTTTRGRGRGRRGRGGRRGHSPPIVYGIVGDAEPLGSIPAHVIEVSSDDSNSDWEDDVTTESGSNDDQRDDYDNDDWYDSGVPGAYYGGYGHCFVCGRSGHWARGCPYR